MAAFRPQLVILASLLLLSGCLPAPDSVPAPTAGARRSTATTHTASVSPSPSPSASSQVVADSTHFFGQVLGLDNKPAVGVSVSGYLISDKGGSLVSNNGSSLVGNNGSGYRVLAAALTTTTDAEGKFSLVSPDGSPLNVEAVQADDVKAIQFNVAKDTQGLVMQLAPTGTISGQVKASAPSVTNFEGVDVFIPGTGYLAKAAADGHYTIPNVPVGSFDLVASKTGLGRGEIQAVKVTSKQTAQAPDITLAVTLPTVAAIAPSNGAVGADITITGDHFGATEGKTFAVTMGGAAAAAPTRVDDKTIKLKVPAGAKSGDVVVTVDGIPSAPQPFTVLQSLAISPRKAQLLLGGQATYTATGKDLDGKDVPNLAVTWSLDGDAITQNNGAVTAAKLGTATLHISSGSLTDSLGVEVVSTLVNVSTFAGAGTDGVGDGPAATATFHEPTSLARDSQGNLYVLDAAAVRKVAPDGTVSTFATMDQIYTNAGSLRRASEMIGFLAVDAADKLYLVDSFSGPIFQLGSDGVGTVLASFPGASMNDAPGGLAIASDGTMYVADTSKEQIRLITGGNGDTVVAGSGTTGYQDGSATTARFNSPNGLVLGKDGALYLADTSNNCIRRIDLTKAPSDNAFVTTFAGSAQAGSADGTGAAASFNAPSDLAVDTNGNLLVCDNGNHRVRLVTPQGVVSTLAGSDAGFVDDTGKLAKFQSLYGVATSGADTVFVSDYENHRLRKLLIQHAP